MGETSFNLRDILKPKTLQILAFSIPFTPDSRLVDDDIGWTLDSKLTFRESLSFDFLPLLMARIKGDSDTCFSALESTKGLE